ncbi:hypothetical protein B0H19DRAFT_1077263 [Mycena capillaripes]|nr:hypothetical protein B0H19DRAFT_1077263 [Mycena capillaripes]
MLVNSADALGDTRRDVPSMRGRSRNKEHNEGEHEHENESKAATEYESKRTKAIYEAAESESTSMRRIQTAWGGAKTTAEKVMRTTYGLGMGAHRSRGSNTRWGSVCESGEEYRGVPRKDSKAEAGEGVDEKEAREGRPSVEEGEREGGEVSQESAERGDRGYTQTVVSRKDRGGGGRGASRRSDVSRRRGRN